MQPVGLDETLAVTGTLALALAAAFWRAARAEVIARTTSNVEQALELARAEAQALTDQLRQARADLIGGSPSPVPGSRAPPDSGG